MGLWKTISGLFKRPAAKSVEVPNFDSIAPKIPGAEEDIPEKVADYKLKRWDAGIFAQELVKEDLAPRVAEEGKLRVNDGQIEEGTYGGTQLALTEMYDRIERA